METVAVRLEAPRSPDIPQLMRCQLGQNHLLFTFMESRYQNICMALMFLLQLLDVGEGEVTVSGKVAQSKSPLLFTSCLVFHIGPPRACSRDSE